MAHQDNIKDGNGRTPVPVGVARPSHSPGTSLPPHICMQTKSHCIPWLCFAALFAHGTHFVAWQIYCLERRWAACKAAGLHRAHGFAHCR